MSYLKDCLDGEGDVYSESLIGFAFGCATEWFEGSIELIKEEGFSPKGFLGFVSILDTPFIFAYYFYTGPFYQKFKPLEKDRKEIELYHKIIFRY